MSASKLNKFSSNTSSFYDLCSASKKTLTLASANAPIQGETIFGECFAGSQCAPQIETERPSPILQTAPLCITFLALIMLFHAYEAELGLVASMIVQLGKYLALKTL